MGQTQKRRIGLYIMVVWMVFLVSQFSLIPQTKAAAGNDLQPISFWQLHWGGSTDTIEDIIAGGLSGEYDWKSIKNGEAAPTKPKDIAVAWIKIQLPPSIPKDYGLYIKKIYAQNLSVYLDNRLIREVKFDYPYDVQRSLFPVSSEDGGHVVYIKLETSLDRLGIDSEIRIDHFYQLTRSFIFQDLQNIIIGCAFLFISVIMLICSLFLNRIQKETWISLSLLILTLGAIFITYSPFMYANFNNYGSLFVDVFDISLAIFLPSLTYFFEKVFDNGKINWLRKVRIFQSVYSGFIIGFMLINHLSHYQLNQYYFLFSVTILGFIMIIQFSIIIGLSLFFVIRGNKEAVIFSEGFATLAATGILDLLLYYIKDQKYQFVLWKFGIIGFILSLIVILGRRFAINQEHMINYSKELEFYNNQLQLSEKMEMISSLAASVAHEVRNPLQVTRGFLQLVSASTDSKNKEYMGIAIEELDRAAVIITDFLTFAKPQMDELTELNVSKEVSQIEGIIVPLATLHGGKISVSVPNDLFIMGNSSKFKQVLINIIKNSIEAFQEDGQIHIWSYEKRDEIFIHIKDNGEGIEPNQLAKLGEPYYSTKTKGTGLGLMVTFRLIDMMKGQVEFKSQRLQGTEVILRFPSLPDKKGAALN
ncbi:ATP-binding protein [Paenibacillus ferrarius]|uniref:ATP-binding protein n=1 Tax=Paenibacillus ferrarius TaxID=1469647 RepID=UPI003D28B486